MDSVPKAGYMASASEKGCCHLHSTVLGQLGQCFVLVPLRQQGYFYLSCHCTYAWAVPPRLSPGASGRSFSFAPWAPHHGLGPALCCTVVLVSVPIPPSCRGFSTPGGHFVLPWTAPNTAACGFLAWGVRSTTSAPQDVVYHGSGPGPNPRRVTRCKKSISSSLMETPETVSSLS